MSWNIHWRLLLWDKDHKDRSLAFLVTALLLIAGAALLATDAKQAVTRMNGGLVRNPSGQGSRIETLKVNVGKSIQKQPLEVEVSERMYTDQEIDKVFKQSSGQMDRWILNGNDTLDKVTSNLDLLTQVPGEPIEVEWELDRYDVMNVRGELIADRIDQKGTPVKLSAVLTYKENPKRQAMYQCAAMVYPKILTGKDKTLAEVNEAIKEREEKTRTKTSFQLPETIQGKKTVYYESMDMRGLLLILMAVLVGVLLLALQKQNERKDVQKKRKQMLTDYPDLINKFTLLLGSGMTAKNVWRKMVNDYEGQKSRWGTRYAYEEMKVTWHEMQSGITEAESYERFGKRCGLQVYLKLGALLSQNLKKGTKGLSQLLKADAIQAFEDRKARAKRLGEEAGTKLLLPMFLMLAIVLVIVVVPAFMSMQM